LAVIWSVQFPPQVDTPNHLARHYLESLWLRGEPLPAGYEVEYRLLPNLGADLVLPVLMGVLEPLAACKVFLSLAVLLYWLGPALFILQEGEGRPGAWAAALLLLPFVLSSAFFWGFLNYYSGVGLAFLAAVHLRHLDLKARPDIPGLLLHAALVALLFFWHLAVVFIYGVLAGTLLLERAWALRREGRGPAACLGRAALLALPLLPAAVLGGLYLAAKAGAPAPPSVWGGPVRKALMPLVLFRGYDGLTDVLVVGLWAAAAVAFFGKPWPVGRGGWPALAAAALLALYLVLPFQWGTTSDADSRLLPALLTCVLAWLAARPVRWPRLGAALLAVALIVRGGAVWHAWHRLDDRLQQEAPSFAHLEDGARVLPAVLISDITKEDPENHFTCLAVIAKRAFVPTVFAYRDQQPLNLHGYVLPAGAVKGGVYTPDAEAVAAHYDYLWVYNPHGIELRLPAHWERTFAGGYVTLWRVRPAAGRGPE
jgi:hypothetical protein